MDEKNMVFHEIMPQALSLMTDVFGNYVIQKVFMFLTLDLYHIFVVSMFKWVAKRIHYIKLKNSILFYTCLTYSVSCLVF